MPIGTRLLVNAPSQAIGAQLLSPYAPFGPAVSFSGIAPEPDVTVVVTADDAAASPVVVHRVVRGGI
jgi:hypothetical protein